MFIIPSDLEGELAKLRAYALRYSMMVAFANFGGPSGGLASGGRSAIWSETGELLVQLEPRGAGVAVVMGTRERRRARPVMLGEPSVVPRV
jgi:NAD+ synthase (glutamine-hydrolysing)